MVKWADEIKDEVNKLHSEGKSIRQIAEKTGKSKSSVGLFLKNSSPELVVNEIVPVEATAEINIPTIIENDMSINADDANNFLQGLSVSRPAPSNAVIPKGGRSSFIEGLINTVPEAEHIPRPSKARGRTALPKEPKTPKPSKLLESLLATKEVEDPQKKPDIIAKIVFNVNNFESLLTDITKGDKDAFLKSLDKMNVSNLEATLRTIETTRSVKNLTNQFMHFFFMGTSFVEVGTTQYLGMNTKGYTMMLQQTSSDEIRMIMQELAMEQKDKFQKIQRPEVRLAMIMTTSLLAVNSQNTLVELRQRQQSQQQERLQPQRQNVQAQPKPNNQPKPEASEPKVGGQAKVNMIIPEDKKADYKDL